MIRSARRAALVSAALLALPLGSVSGSAATAAAVQELPRGTAASTVAEPPCTNVNFCEPVVGAGAEMAVPLVRPWLRGTDGGWDLFTSCCTQINPGRLGTVSGLINDQPAVVVPGGGFEIGGSLTGSATSTVVYGVSGTSYRYARFVSAVSRQQDDSVESWTVSSDVYSWSCHQRGAGRNPLTDCGNGIQQYTRGRTRVPAPPNPRAYSVVLPLSYYARVIDSRGRPLANPYRTSTGHWLLQAQAQYHGWIWTVEWTVGNVGLGRVAGSSYIGGSRIVLTDGPFN